MARYLHVVAAMDRAKIEDEVPLPDDWDDMTLDDQQQWADDTLAAHVDTTVESWHEVR